MSEDIQKIEFDAFIGKDDWPILEPFTEDKDFGGFAELGLTTIYAEPGKPKDYIDPKKSWPPIRVKVTIEKIMMKPPKEGAKIKK